MGLTGVERENLLAQNYVITVEHIAYKTQNMFKNYILK